MSSRSTRHSRAASALLCLGLVLAACGGDDSGSSDETTASTAAASDTTAASADTTAASADTTGAPVNADTTRRLRLIGTNGVQQMDPVTGVVPCEAEMLRWVYDTLIRQAPDGTLVPAWPRAGRVPIR